MTTLIGIPVPSAGLSPPCSPICPDHSRDGDPPPESGRGCGPRRPASGSAQCPKSLPSVAPGRWEDWPVKHPAGGLREEGERAPEPPGPPPGPPRRSWRPAPSAAQAAAALLLYAATSIALFGIPILSAPSSRYVG